MTSTPADAIAIKLGVLEINATGIAGIVAVVVVLVVLVLGVRLVGGAIKRG
jgi:hypothetical protein